MPAANSSMSDGGSPIWSHISFGGSTETVEATAAKRLWTLFMNFLSIVRKTLRCASSAVQRWKASANCASPKVVRR